MKRTLSFFLALTCAALLICSGIHTAQAAGSAPAGNGQPYYIIVNRAMNTVTVYELDEEGYYTVPVKAMVCSVGRKGHATPTGSFSLGGRWAWVHMIDGSYGQYCTQIRGNILFHSVCYAKRSPSTLITQEYNGLGEPASLGCVRLQTVDAKWIYDNCGRGTKVTVLDDPDSPGPLGKPDKLVEYISEEEANGWDPTDPREENPWHEILAPKEQTVSCALAAQVLYELSGEEGLEDPADILAWAVENGLLGDGEEEFDPERPITRQELIAILYRFETVYCRRAPGDSDSLDRFSDGESVHSSARAAMGWAVGAGLIQGTSENTLHPTGYASRDQLDIILLRYSRL